MDDFSHMGFGLFAGLILGANLGNYFFFSPGPGALVGGALGVGLGYFLDRRK